MQDIEAGLKNLKELMGFYGQLSLTDTNEANTREKVIDSMLEAILGWDKNYDIDYESRVSEDGLTTYADYKISTANTSIIVEAKKTGASFTLPNNRTTLKLGGVLAEGEIGEAIRQVRDYSRKLSIPYSVITNGNAWVIFPSIRTDGITFDETVARIFRSLEDIKYRFVEFWELLSKQRVVEGGLENEIFGKKDSFNSRRLITLFKEPGFRLGRNSIYEHIEPAVNLALSDESLLEDIEALEICYIKSTDRLKYDTRLHMYLKDLKPPLERKVIRVRKAKNVTALDEKLENYSRKKNQFILLLGPVGAGKTTFLHYTRKVSARLLIDGKITWFYIDYKFGTQEDSPREFIYKQILKLIDEDREFNLGEWDNSIKPAYGNEISSLKKGALRLLSEADVNEFNKKISEMILREKEEIEPFVQKIISNSTKFRPGFLVIDNVDQITDEGYQNKIFQEAQAAARIMNLNVIMSIRESTYLKHRDSPIFNAFQVDTIYIDPPQIMPVLSRRFTYAKKVLKGKEAEIVSETGKRMRVKDLSSFFEIVAKSLLVDEAGFLIEVLSGGDIRRGLQLIREFLSSGHISADQVLFTYLTKGEYRKFPSHEVFKGIILGQKKYYREEESLLLNIFDSKLGYPFPQLLRFRILNMLTQFAAEATFEGLPHEELESKLYQIGIKPPDIEQVINSLLACRLIYTDDGRELYHHSKLLPTRLGGYIVRELSRQFLYLEPCLIDASIFIDEHWHNLQIITEQIDQASNPDKLKLRIDRANMFLDYLAEIDQSWISKAKRYNLTEEYACELFNASFLETVKGNFQEVLSNAEKVLRSKKKQSTKN